MSRFKVIYNGAVWEADLICDPAGNPVAWQIYGYPCSPETGGVRQNHWVPVAAAAQVINTAFTVSSSTVNEPGTTGTAPMVFQVNLTAPSTNTLTLSYATQPAGATPNLDYTPTSGLLVFLPGETSKNVTVQILGDTVSPEIGERVALQVSQPTTSDPPISGYGTIGDFPWNPNNGDGYVYSPLRHYLGRVLDAIDDFIPRFWDRT